MLKKPWIAVVALCLSLFIVLALIKFFQIRAAIAFGESFPEPSETVSATVVSTSTWQSKLEVSGELRAPKELALRTEVAGVIAKIGFQAGETVNEGDVLLQLDISEEQASLNALTAQFTLAEQDVKRLDGVKNRDAISQQQVDQARSRFDSAKAELATVKENIANKTVVAPFSGVTGLHDFEVGEYIAANTVVTQLVGNTDQLWVDFSLPQQFGAVNVGDAVSLHGKGLFAGAIAATVSVVDPAFSRETRGLGVRAVLDNSQIKLIPGAFVRVSAPVGAPQAVVRVPSTAVRRDTFGSFVFALELDANNDRRARRLPVTELAKDGLDSLLQASDNLTSTADNSNVRPTIATLGAFKLRAGILVNIDSLLPSNDANRGSGDAVNAPAILPSDSLNSSNKAVLTDVVATGAVSKEAVSTDRSVNDNTSDLPEPYTEPYTESRAESNVENNAANEQGKRGE